MVRNGKINIHGILIRREVRRKRFRFRGGIGLRSVEQEPVRKDSRGAQDYKSTLAQCFVVQSEFTEAPWFEVKGLHMKVQHTFNKPVVQLQMLGCQQGTFRPDYRLEDLHLKTSPQS